MYIVYLAVTRKKRSLQSVCAFIVCRLKHISLFNPAVYSFHCLRLQQPPPPTTPLFNLTHVLFCVLSFIFVEINKYTHTHNALRWTVALVRTCPSGPPPLQSARPALPDAKHALCRPQSTSTWRLPGCPAPGMAFELRHAPSVFALWCGKNHKPVGKMEHPGSLSAYASLLQGARWDGGGGARNSEWCTRPQLTPDPGRVKILGDIRLRLLCTRMMPAASHE